MASKPDPHEKRAEPRYPTTDSVILNVLGGPYSLQAKVLDSSRSGLKLEVSKPLTVGTMVEIVAISGLSIFAEVRYCLPCGAVFHAGLLLQQQYPESKLRD